MGTIQRQGLINIIIVYIGVVLGFVNAVIIQPHFMKQEDVGLARIIFNFSGFLTPFLLVGSSNMCLKYFPVFRDREKKHHGFLGFMLLITLTGIVLVGLVLFLIKGWIIDAYKDESAQFVHYFGLTFLLGAIMSLTIAMNIYSSSLFRTTFPSLLNDIWVRILYIGVTLIYAFGLISLDAFVWGILLAYFSQLLFLFIYVYSIDRPGLRIDWPFVKSVGLRSILRFCFLIMLSAMSTLSMKFLDGIMIGAYLPLKFVAIFTTGAFIAQFIETPINPVERIAGARIAHAFRDNNMHEIKEIYYRSVRYLFLLGGFLVVCVITGIHDFLLLISHEYSGAANVTIILSIGSIINMATGVNSPILQNSANYIWGTIFLFILLVLSVVLNMLFIPRFGIEGAAIATGLASALYNILKFIYIWKKFGLQPYDIRTLKTIVVIGIALVVGLLVSVNDNPLLSLALKGISIAAVYAAATFFLNIIPEFHDVILKKVFRKR